MINESINLAHCFFFLVRKLIKLFPAKTGSRFKQESSNEVTITCLSNSEQSFPLPAEQRGAFSS